MSRVDVVTALAEQFEVASTHSNLLEHMEMSAQEAKATTVGVEVEVKYSSYFPYLFDKYGLDKRSIGSLLPIELDRLTKDTAVFEKALLPKLEKTVELGVPKGKDRYWEFANDPVYHPKTLAEELYVLQHADLIPMDVKHSLHITLGGMSNNVDAYMLLMCMEMLGYTSKDRLLAGIMKRKAIGWGKKGFGGIRVRNTDLKLGAGIALEMRTLELPMDTNSVYEMLYTIWFLAECIRRHDLYHHWMVVRDALEEIATEHNLDTSKNWNRAFTKVDHWIKYANVHPLIDPSGLKRIILEQVRSIDMTEPKNKYLSFTGYH